MRIGQFPKNAALQSGGAKGKPQKLTTTEAGWEP